MYMLLNSGLIAAVTLSAAAAIAFGDVAKAELAVTVPPGSNLPVVESVDLNRYSGTWYEQARLPNRFQAQCASNVEANYSLREDATVKVINSCLDDQGQTVAAEGEGRNVAATGAPRGQLEVRFAPRWLSWLSVVWGDYWIIGLDPGYKISLVGTPDREFLWLLSRDRKLSRAEINTWMDKAAALGFPVEKVVQTSQSPNRAAQAVSQSVSSR